MMNTNDHEQKFRIVRVTLRQIELPLVERFAISSGWIESRAILLLELEDETGAHVWSECVAGDLPNYSPETIDTAWLALREWLLPRILGTEIEAPQLVTDLLDRGVTGHHMAKAAIEMGCWGLAAEIAKMSLSQFLGGTRKHVATGISIGLQDSPNILVEKAEAAVAAGYRKIKLKISPGSDIDYVAAVREALGPNQPLSVDANAAYTLDDRDHLAELDAFDLIMIEQPLSAGDLWRHAELQKQLTTPICIDESVVDPASAEDMLAMGAGTIINIKPGRVGGFHNARRIHDIAKQAGHPVWCGGMLESGIGRAYNVALASLPNFDIPGDLSPSKRYWEQDVVTPEWTMNTDGFVNVPLERVGIGVDPDRDRIEDLTTRSDSMTAAINA